MTDDSDTFECKVEIGDDETATLRLGVELARNWREQIDDQLAHGPGGVVRLGMIQPDGRPLTFELPPLVAESMRDDIAAFLEGREGNGETEGGP